MLSIRLPLVRVFERTTLCVFACLASTACAAPGNDSMLTSSRCDIAGAALRTGTHEVGSFELLACPVSDTVAVGEDIPVLVLLVNRSASALFADGAIEPGSNLFFEVLGPDGHPYSPFDRPYPNEPMEVRQNVFVRHGIIGRTVNLLCELPGDVIIDEPSQEVCQPSVELSMPGEYTVTVQARVHWCPRQCPFDETKSVLLESEPFSVIVRR